MTQDQIRTGGSAKAGKTPASECIHCGACQKDCRFLSKYNIDIGDSEALREHAYSCFLCGKCTDVCPVGIDGRAEVLAFRRERAAGEERPVIEKTYKGNVKEKSDYIYRNYACATSGTVFFPGCNFPSLFPKTAKEVSKLLYEKAGIGTVYDCCGKPIAELGMSDVEERIFEGLEARIRENGITEIVTACPNCFGFFGDRLSVPVVNIYAKLRELGLGGVVERDFTLFLPCPDRYSKAWIEDIRPFVDGEIICIEDIQCCGLGGSAIVPEPELSKGFTAELKAKYSGEIQTYCASCAGSIKRNGYKEVRHVLSYILGVNELADTLKSYINRMRTKNIKKL